MGTLPNSRASKSPVCPEGLLTVTSFFCRPTSSILASCSLTWHYLTRTAYLATSLANLDLQLLSLQKKRWYSLSGRSLLAALVDAVDSRTNQQSSTCNGNRNAKRPKGRRKSHQGHSLHCPSGHKPYATSYGRTFGGILCGLSARLAAVLKVKKVFKS